MNRKNIIARRQAKAFVRLSKMEQYGCDDRVGDRLRFENGHVWFTNRFMAVRLKYDDLYAYDNGLCVYVDGDPTHTPVNDLNIWAHAGKGDEFNLSDITHWSEPDEQHAEIPDVAQYFDLPIEQAGEYDINPAMFHDAATIVDTFGRNVHVSTRRRDDGMRIIQLDNRDRTRTAVIVAQKIANKNEAES